MQSKKAKGTNTVVHGNHNHVLAVAEVTAIIHIQRRRATVETWKQNILNQEKWSRAPPQAAPMITDDSFNLFKSKAFESRHSTLWLAAHDSLKSMMINYKLATPDHVLLFFIGREIRH